MPLNRQETKSRSTLASRVWAFSLTKEFPSGKILLLSPLPAFEPTANASLTVIEYPFKKMSKFMQYVVALLVIVAIAAVDRFLIVESIAVSTPADMVWIEGSEFAASAPAEFTDRDATQDAQSAGFWIDSATVSRASYQEFLEQSGHAGTADVKPSWLPVDGSAPNLPHMDAIYALREEGISSTDATRLHYVSSVDALAYCNWKGLGLSNSDQRAAAGHKRGAAAEIAVHASQPMSQLSGFRCVTLSD